MPISRIRCSTPSLKNRPVSSSANHQEEAEVDEVLAEIGGAVRRLQALRLHGDNRQAQLSRDRWPRAARSRTAACRRENADRGQAAEARAPKLLAARQRG